MGESAPKTDRELILRWEWVRRADWLPSFLGIGKQKPVLRAFADLAKLLGVKNALHAGCGLGTDAVCLGDMGVNVAGCDTERATVERAQQMAAAASSPVTFFVAPWHAFKQSAPHGFDAILCEGLGDVPEWTELQRMLAAIHATLRPGGFLMFIGAGQNDPEDVVKKAQAAEMLEDAVEWRYKDGPLLCTKVVQKRRAPDYIDETCLFVVNDPSGARVESTARRRPAYWTWKHWSDLVREAGFCHLETREYAAYGNVRVNVAWKSKDATAIDTAGRDTPYLD